MRRCLEMRMWSVLVVFFAGCGTSLYPYRVMNDDCSCEVFRVRDEKANVVYSFSAVYSVDGAMKTRITVSMQNNNTDTLDLSLAYVRLSSRNISYRYNGKFLALTIASIPPGKERALILEGEGEEVKEADPWRPVAGEELVLTLKGVRVHRKTIATQVVRFVPHNPKLSL